MPTSSNTVTPDGPASKRVWLNTDGTVTELVMVVDQNNNPVVPAVLTGTPLLPATGPATLAINTDAVYTFSTPVHHVVVQNNSGTLVNVGLFDPSAANAGSYNVPAYSERAFDVTVTVVHLFSAAATAVNGATAANIVLFGAV